MQKEDRLSFCINLEVVNLEIKNPTFVFWEKLWLNNLVSRLTDLYIVRVYYVRSVVDTICMQQVSLLNTQNDPRFRAPFLGWTILHEQFHPIALETLVEASYLFQKQRLCEK